MPIAMPGFLKQDPGFKRPHSTPHVTYWPYEVCKRYGLSPIAGLSGANSSRIKIGIISLGGGYDPADVNAAIDQQNAKLKSVGSSVVLQYPDLTDVSVLGGKNRPGDPADIENLLDIQIIAGGYSYMTGMAADIWFYCAPNSDAGIAAAISQADADGCGVVSFSWGAAEKNYPANSRTVISAAIHKFTARGGKFLAASGDNGSTDGDQGANVDYTGSDTNTICVGGTTLTTASETVWGTSTPGEGTGGGYSFFYEKPAWQNGNTNAKRLCPDIAANADPMTGWNIVASGSIEPIGGTSASTPFWAALIGAMDTARAVNGSPLIVSFVQWAYVNTACFNDITVGNNGQFSAKTGLDPCTGLGSPTNNLIIKYVGANPTQPPIPPAAQIPLWLKVLAGFANFDVVPPNTPDEAAGLKPISH